MAVVREVSVEITGQVPDDYNNNDYDLLLAELNAVAIKFNLDLEEKDV